MCRSYQVPFSIVELGTPRHADDGALFADLHLRDAIFQRQHEPVLPVHGVPVKNHPFWVKRPELKD